VHRVPSLNLRLDPDLVAEVRELAGPGELTKSINAAMRMWLGAQRAPKPEPAAAARAPVAPVLGTLAASWPLPPHAYRPPGR
jgi:hypothetical protein